MVCVASPLALDSGQLFPVQLSVPLEAEYSRGGLEVACLDPEGTSGIPLCSWKRKNWTLVWSEMKKRSWIDSPAPRVVQ